MRDIVSNHPLSCRSKKAVTIPGVLVQIKSIKDGQILSNGKRKGSQTVPMQEEVLEFGESSKSTTFYGVNLTVRYIKGVQFRSV